MSKRNRKRGNRQSGGRDRNAGRRVKDRGFSSPGPKKDRRIAVDPWRNLKRLLPPLPPEEYESLKRSIAQHGVGVPSIVDVNGDIVDGDHREHACKELGIHCPREIRDFSSELEKIELAVSLNITRRHLTRKQKRELIAAILRANPQINDRHLGDITKVSKNTVADERKLLEATGQIDHLPQRLGRDGKFRPAKYRRIIANTPKEQEKAIAAIKNLPASCEGKILDVLTASRRARKCVAKQTCEGEAIQPTRDEDVQIYHCDVRDLEKASGLSPGSVDAIITDIPYGPNFLSQFPDLVQFALRVLVDGGLFVTLAGKLYLDVLMAELGKHLRYGWMHASVWQGEGSVMYCRQVTSRWKPVIIYSKGNWRKRERWADVSQVPKEKDWHDWQQPLEEVEMMVQNFSDLGDMVVDPCGGAFTTAVACKQLGRRFIGCDIERECVLKGQVRLKAASEHGAV